MTTVPAKSVFKSKTLIVNALVIVATLITALSTTNLPFVNTEWFVTILAAVNFGLRLTTKQPVSTEEGKFVDVHD